MPLAVNQVTVPVATVTPASSQSPPEHNDRGRDHERPPERTELHDRPERVACQSGAPLNQRVSAISQDGTWSRRAIAYERDERDAGDTRDESRVRKRALVGRGPSAASDDGFV